MCKGGGNPFRVTTCKLLLRPRVGAIATVPARALSNESSLVEDHYFIWSVQSETADSIIRFLSIA